MKVAKLRVQVVLLATDHVRVDQVRSTSAATAPLKTLTSLSQLH